MYRSSTDTEWVHVSVSLSPLLASRIANRSTDRYDQLPLNISYVDHEFISDIKSPEYEDSPYRIVQYEPSKDSNIPMNIALECVDELPGIAIRDIITKKVIAYDNKYLEAKYWMRVQVIKLLNNVGLDRKFVDPDIKMIPVIPGK